MKTPMSVVMIGDFPRDPMNVGGGVESVMLYLSQALGRLEDLRLVVVTMDRWGLGDRVVTGGGVDVHYVARTAVRGPVSRLINRRRLARKVSSLAPDLIHAHIAGQYSSAAHATGIPYVLTLHGIRYLEANLRTGLIDRAYRRHLIRAEERTGVRRAEHLISINPFIDETFGDAISGNLTHIENPVAEPFFSVPEVSGDSGLLYVGRLTPRKDILTLLEAFRALRRDVPRAHLRLAGAPDTDDGGRYLREIESFIDRHGLTDSVHLLGNLDEERVLQEYGQCAVFVMSSVLETAPMSIAQALAAGRPVVTTDAGGCRHMLEEGITGRVVPIGDPAALAAALAGTLVDGDVIRTMGRAARESASQRFRADAIARRTVAFYARIPLAKKDAR